MAKLNIQYSEEEYREFEDIALAMLEDGKSKNQIRIVLGIGSTTIEKIIERLIQTNRITRERMEEIREAKKQAEREEMEARLRPIILDGIEANLSYEHICELDEFDASIATLKKIVKKLKDEGVITDENIKASNREKSREKIKVSKYQEVTKDIKKRVLELLEIGVAERRIANILSIDIGILAKIKNELICEGCITRGEIEEVAENRRIQDKETTCKLLKEGYSITEIIENIPYSQRNYIHRFKEQLKREGKITEEEIKEAQYNRKEKHKMECIIAGLRKGLSYEEIANGYQSDKAERLNKDAVYHRKVKAVEEGLITEDEIEMAKKLRGSQEGKSDYVGPHDEEILRLFKLGFNYEQIATVLGLARNSIKARKNEIKKQGRITQEEIDENIEDGEKNASKRRNAISNMIIFVADLDFNIVNEHIYYSKAKMELGELDERDIEILMRVITMSDEFVTLGNVKFVTTCLTRDGRNTMALNFLDECIECIADNSEEKREKLKNVKKLIERSIAKQKAEKMLRAGVVSEGFIRDKTGLSFKAIKRCAGKSKH